MTTLLEHLNLNALYRSSQEDVQILHFTHNQIIVGMNSFIITCVWHAFILRETCVNAISTSVKTTFISKVQVIRDEEGNYYN